MELILNVEIMLRFSKVRQDLTYDHSSLREQPRSQNPRESPLHRLTVDGLDPDHLALRHVDLPLSLSDGLAGPSCVSSLGILQIWVAELYFVRKIG